MFACAPSMKPRVLSYSSCATILVARETKSINECADRNCIVMKWAPGAREKSPKNKLPGFFTQALRKLETNLSHRISGISLRTTVPQNTAPPKMACHVRFVVERLYAGLTINELPKKSARGPTESNISQDHFDRNDNFPNPVK